MTDSAVALVLPILKIPSCTGYIGIGFKLTEHRKVAVDLFLVLIYL